MRKENKSTEKNNPDYQSYLSAFSHKLKNPIHSIGINLDVVRTKVKKALGEKSEDIQKQLDIVMTELDHIHRLTNCFSEILLIKNPQKSKIVVQNMIQESLNLLKLKYPESYRLIDYTHNTNKSKIFVNKEDISRALLEIVTNAVEASHDKKRVMIRTAENQHSVEILISDKGHGLSKKDQNRIFDLFYTTKRGKLGCGLSLARRLIEVNSGQLVIHSQINKGTTFLLRFHLAG